MKKKEIVNVKENKYFEKTNLFFTESPIKKNSEYMLICEKITTTQLTGVIKQDKKNHRNEKYLQDLRMANPNPKRKSKINYDSYMINQSLLHKNKKTFYEHQRDKVIPEALPKELGIVIPPINTFEEQSPSVSKPRVLNSPHPVLNEIPGKGKKILLVGFVDGIGLNFNKITSILDSGSGTSLVSLNVVNKFNLGFFRTKMPVAFYGINGCSEQRRDIAIVDLCFEGENIAIPAYVVDGLPGGIDLLIGMDQIGKNFSMFIPFTDNNFNKENSTFISDNYISSVNNIMSVNNDYINKNIIINNSDYINKINHGENSNDTVKCIVSIKSPKGIINIPLWEVLDGKSISNILMLSLV